MYHQTAWIWAPVEDHGRDKGDGGGENARRWRDFSHSTSRYARHPWVQDLSTDRASMSHLIEVASRLGNRHWAIVPFSATLLPLLYQLPVFVFVIVCRAKHPIKVPSHPVIPASPGADAVAIPEGSVSRYTSIHGWQWSKAYLECSKEVSRGKSRELVADAGWVSRLQPNRKSLAPAEGVPAKRSEVKDQTGIEGWNTYSLGDCEHC